MSHETTAQFVARVAHQSKWFVVARAVSDWGYVFHRTQFATEEDARAEFAKRKAHAKEHGGAGSLELGYGTVEKFSIWCPND